MPRVLHLADLHLGWMPRDLDDERARLRRARRDSLLAHAVDTALAEAVDVVVVAGDLFETFDPEPELVERALAQLGRLSEAGITVVTVPGNHDELTYAGSVYRRWAERWPGVLITTPMPAKVASLALDGTTLHVYGVAYVGGVTDVREAVRAFPAPEGDGLHLFLAHGTLVGGGGSAWARERSLPLDREALAAAGYDYVALGHLHVPSEVRLGRALAVYPGCVGGKGIDDVGARHWTLVTLGAGHAQLQRVAAPAQPLRDLTLDVTGMSGADAVLLAIRDLGDPDALVRVTLRGALPAAIEPAYLEARARGDFFQLEVRDATTAVSAAVLDDWSAAPTVLGAFVRRMRQRLEEAPDDDTRALVTRALLRGVDALQGRS
jgi:DNA repair protein SbcD/Mre11